MIGKLFKYTGNPFVDGGLVALNKLVEKEVDEIEIVNLEKILEKIFDLYTKPAWHKNLYSIFPNNPLTNPSVDNEKYLEFLNDLVAHITQLGEKGNCIACGKRNVVDKSFKGNVPLTGSGKLINYFSYGTDGADYCPNCLFLVQLLPLFLYRCGGNFLLLHSDSEKLLKFWAKQSFDNINEQFLLNNFTGCYNESITRPENAMFSMIGKIVQKVNRWREETIPIITFYYFSNYNQNPDLRIFYLPSKVFKFLIEIPPDEKTNWKNIVKYAYKFVKWEKIKNEEDYKNNPNYVYERLLKNQSIIGFFFYKKNVRKVRSGWRLLEAYMTMVRNMDKERIDAIKKVGDLLVDYIKDNEDISTITKIERAKTYNSFNSVLRKIIKKRISLNAEEPLFSFDDYVKYLFPDGNLTWRLTQSLILFRIYECLHEYLVENKKEVKEIIESDELEEE
ncbi:MAG: type I-B CRISPR-associated protein Cas8b1/Cst1 [Methanobrevibacter sp.]|nr:type I-B CRISPR-associated protein Cas8b1/Cst1 [Methanobrevibacter sp.]